MLGTTAFHFTSGILEFRRRKMSKTHVINYENILIPELNLGQLEMLIRARFLIDTIGYNKIEGKPFTSSEILDKIEKIIKDK